MTLYVRGADGDISWQRKPGGEPYPGSWTSLRICYLCMNHVGTIGLKAGVHTCEQCMNSQDWELSPLPCKVCGGAGAVWIAGTNIRGTCGTCLGRSADPDKPKPPPATVPDGKPPVFENLDGQAFRYEKCVVCHGWGHLDDGTKDCHYGDTSGQIMVCADCNGHGRTSPLTTCAPCRGFGRFR